VYAPAKWCPKFRVVRLHSTDEAERLRLRKEVVLNVDSYDVAAGAYTRPLFRST
jgi:SWI/SNF-related matrix-associated actin-dependent regulator of chromatin subfamily A member 5